MKTKPDAIKLAALDAISILPTSKEMDVKYGFKSNPKMIFKYLFGEYRGAINGTHQNQPFANFVYANIIAGKPQYK